ncbi:DNA polymerase III subunit gamma/tau [Meiothermus sp.]|uniref:DNA polymerase III subunit gamma/tau n=1 Tax=Meiothermus sp. TaxID=1955249 RepID=UPI0021DF15AD|nr:DNA polymerase III subunit gamma/tau [Meiothermus sp.]GIW33826.1 MAG: DNA polymerase III subunit gamma/tau [Meiothermus sp.]
MSALYRQARPTTFDEMVGQEHVKEVLLNALRQGKLAQAYLFSGPRGVGKTSSARLIAQAVNCSSDPKPCGVCEGCRLVREGRHPDVLEIDAASNNSVEDVRDLRERILLAPILGQHKVVILDEAHMMSKSAFNALLKTLEEPPPHVIFIFATTEPERMPPTILSRTQHFRFRRLSEAEIVEKLQRILASLGREAEPPALQLVARLADGAMRDAESLLDRLLTLEGPLTLQQTEEALGLPPQEALFAVAEALDKGQIRQALEQAQHLYTQGFAARTLAQGLLEALRAGLYGRMGLGTGPHLNQPEERIVAAMTALDEAMERLLKRSDALSLELAILSAYQALHAAPVAYAVPAASPAIPDFDPRPKKVEGRGPRVEGQERSSIPPSALASSVADLASEWRRVMGALKITIRGFVREAEPRFEEDRVVLLFPEQKSFHHQGAQKHLGEIQKAVREVLGIEQVELQLGKKKLTDEPLARAFSPGKPIPPAATGQVEPAVPPAEPTPAPEHPQPLPTENLPIPPGSSAAPVEPAPADTPWEEPNPSLLHPPVAGPPEPAPWNPEASLDQTPPEEASDDTEAKPANEASLLEDPRFQKLVQLFGGRLRKFYPEAPREAALEAASTDLEEEPD